MRNEKLIHRLNRVVGQIQGLKRRLELESTEDDCVQTLQQLKASVNGLKKFGEAYILEHLHHCMANEKKPKEMQKTLSKVISSAFFL